MTDVCRDIEIKDVCTVRFKHLDLNFYKKYLHLPISEFKKECRLIKSLPILLSTPITRKLLFLFSSRSILSQNCQSLTLSIVVWKTTSFPDILWKKKREEEKKKKAKQENTYSSFDISYRRAQSRKCNRRQWPGTGSSRHRVTAFKWQRRCLFGKRAINVGAERGGGIGHPPGKNVKATFSPIVARPPFSLACALAEDKCYSDFIRVRVSVATLLASQPGLFRVVREGLLFLWTVLYMCVYLYKTRYVPMKGSIRKSIVALLQRSFAVYRYVFAFILPCFAVGHCLEMDVSISLVSCRRDYCINPSASLFFFSFFRRLSSFLLFFFHISSWGRWNWQVTWRNSSPLYYPFRGITRGVN